MTDRTPLIKKIEEIRGTKVICYITTMKPGIASPMSPAHIRHIKRLLDGLPKDAKIDLFICSNGGDSSTPWPLVNLIREHTQHFSVLIPFRAFSAATSVAIGADEIVMTEMGTMGPIDPTVTNEFNPVVNNRAAGISVEDISHYSKLARKVFRIKDKKGKVEVFTKLAADIRPLALGNAYRHYVKAREDGKKLLDFSKDWWIRLRRNKIIDTLVEKLYFHGHHVNRREAKKIGLNVIFAEGDLQNAIWQLYETYEKNMGMTEAYRDEPTTGRVIPVVAFESADRCDTISVQQKITPMTFPATTRLTIYEGKPVAIIENNGVSQLLPIISEGSPLVLNGQIYDKVEHEVFETVT